MYSTQVSSPSTPTMPRRRAAAKPSSRPLLVRADAAFRCFGDGLCCTDVHLLGPVTVREKRALDLLEPGVLRRDAESKSLVFRTQASGACVLRSRRGCELHAVHGEKAKPDGCVRFPFGLIATPEGGRITTHHRCPCRSLGARPPLSPEEAEASLRDGAGRLRTDGSVHQRVQLAPGRSVTFARYRVIEQGLLDALLIERLDPQQVLGPPPKRIAGVRFADLLRQLDEGRDGTAYGEALAWFAAALRAQRSGAPFTLGPRPWAPWFTRAEQREGRRRAQDVFADWLADQIWSLDWVFTTGDLRAGLKELALLYGVAKLIADRLKRARVRADRAAAEAVMIAELVREGGVWEEVQQAL